jgi:hypothetical protein
MQDETIQLDDNQIAIMNELIAHGEDPRDAKVRVLCIARPPDNFKVIPTRYQAYPRCVYHPNGKSKTVANEASHKKASEEGWKDEPAQANLDALQVPMLPKHKLEPDEVAVAAEEKKRKRAAAAA